MRARFQRIAATFLFTAAAGLMVAQEAPFRVEQDKTGKWWFVDAKGEQFVSMGINTILDAHSWNAPAGSTYYDPIPTVFGGDFSKWQQSVSAILHGNNFNTIGAWSSPKVNDGTLLETPILYVADHRKLRMLEALSPDYEKDARARIKAVMGELSHPEKVLGVFLDNEMAWYGMSPWDDNPRHTILEEAVRIAGEEPYKQVAIDFLKSRHASAEEMGKAWGISIKNWDDLTFELMRGSNEKAAMDDRETFLANVAEEFYRKSTAAVRAELPGVLILGSRYAGNAQDSVIKACAKYCDIVSFNNYRARPTADEFLVSRYWLLGQKPMMLTEYSWRGKENTSGNPNSGGAGSVVETQKDRGDRYASFVPDVMEYPMIVGMHWFQFSDQSPQGRFDGENSNYGVVDIQHRPYTDLLNAMAKTNAAIAEVHRTSTKPAPTEMPKRNAVSFSPGQFPNRPPSMDLVKLPTVSPVATFNATDAWIGAERVPEGLRVKLNTGAQWGCGLTMHGPSEQALKWTTNNATDLDGYEALVFEANLPKGMDFRIVLDEAGVDAPGSMKFDTSGGDDGESFAFPQETSKGGNQVFRYEFKDLEARGEWGNQEGARKVDLQSLKGPAIVFGSGFPEAEVLITSLRFEK